MASELTPSHPRTPDEMQFSQEINLRDIFLFLKKGKKRIGTTAVLGIICASAYLIFVQPTYTATANIQMAYAVGKAIEEPDVLAEKIKIPLYFSTATINECLPQTSDRSPEIFAKELKSILYRRAPILGVSFEAKDPDASLACVNAIFKNIQSNQQALIQSIIDTKTAQIKRLTVKVREIEKNQEELRKKYSDGKIPGSADLWFAMITANDKDIQNLTNQINDLEIALVPPQTMPTRLVTPIYSLDIQPTLRITIALALGLVIGLFSGIILLMLQNIRQRLIEIEDF